MVKYKIKIVVKKDNDKWSVFDRFAIESRKRKPFTLLQEIVKSIKKIV